MTFKNTFCTAPGRRLATLVLGITSMLLYNYYTSSVVSWLLNAPAPTIASLDGLIRSDLELVFEDIGYTRGWLAVRIVFEYVMRDQTTTNSSLESNK